MEHGTLKAWLFSRNLSDNNECVCGNGNEDRKHVLFHCDMYASFRYLEEMGIIEHEDGTFDCTGVLKLNEKYECFWSFVNRAYKIRSFVSQTL